MDETALLRLVGCDCDMSNTNTSPGIEFESAYRVKVNTSKYQNVHHIPLESLKESMNR